MRNILGGTTKMYDKSKISQIFVKDIENGMVIAKDVLDSNGGLLLAEGFEIKEAFKIKRLLNQYNVLFASIIKEEIESIPNNQVHITEKTQLLVSDSNRQIPIKSINEFNENKEVLKESFDRFIKGEKIERHEVEKKINDTLNIFKGNINIFQLMQSVKHSDDITYSHCHNVALVSYSMGQWLGLDEKDLQELALSGMLIDIGKIQIDDKLLNKEGKLTNDEFLDLKKHSIFSHEIIKDYEFISDRVKSAVLCHHERMDGSGYPLGLKDDKISLFARIIAIADVYNALISHRPYRNKKTPFEAIRILETEYMDKLDANILYLFLHRVASNYIGQEVTLSSGDKGEIVFIPKHNLFRPIIKLKNQEQILDLSHSHNTHLDIVEFC